MPDAEGRAPALLVKPGETSRRARTIRIVSTAEPAPYVLAALIDRQPGPAVVFRRARRRGRGVGVRAPRASELLTGHAAKAP